MKTKGVENVKLGMFVAAGAAFLIFTLYMIGRNRNLFDSQDLQKITQRINNSNMDFGGYLSDTGITQDIKQTVVNLKLAGQKTAHAANQIAELVKGVNRGEGLIGKAIRDTTLFNKLMVTLTNVESASASASRTTEELDRIVKDIKAGHGTAGVLLSDTAMAHQMQRTLTNLEQGTSRFNENMEALKHNWLTRGYFKDQEKASKKAKENSKK